MMAEYVWRNNLACVATYKVMEGDQFLDQFDDIATPFEQAGGLKLGQLPYFPATTSNSDIVELVAMEFARKFMRYLTKLYTVKKQTPGDQSAAILSAFAAAFSKKDTTLAVLAGLVDDKIKFPDEA